jgi:hypothetical protein
LGDPFGQRCFTRSAIANNTEDDGAIGHNGSPVTMRTV